MKIAFIGLGIMGSRMAAHLLKNGVDTTVWNRSKAPVQELQGKGAKAASSANEAVSEADIVFSMLSTPEVVKDIFFGETGCLSAMKNTLPTLPVSAPFTKFKADMIRTGNYDVQFPLEWMHKDLHLAALTAYELKQPLYLANLTKELFAEANRSGLGRFDFAAIYQYLSSNK